MNEPNEGGYDRHEVREPNGPRGGYVVSDRSPGGSLTHSIPHGPSSPLYLRRSSVSFVPFGASGGGGGQPKE